MFKQDHGHQVNETGREGRVCKNHQPCFNIGTRDRNRPIRALHVIPGDEQGSSMIFSKREVTSLKRVGVNVQMFFLASRTSPVLLFKEWVRLRGVMRAFKPHLIHAQFGTVTGSFCAFGTGIPLVVTFRGSDLNPNPTTSPTRDMFSKVLSHVAAFRASRIICVSMPLTKQLWFGRKRTSVITNGTNLKVFFPRCKEETRTQLGWNQGDQIVLFNAGSSPVGKRLDLAEAAVAAAGPLCQRLRLIVLDGTIDPERIPLFLNAADCLLLTSDWEGSPAILKEAMACNLPVVAVDVGDVVERLAGIYPSVIAPRNAEQLGKAVVEILATNRRSNAYGQIQDLSEEQIALSIRNLYEEIVPSEMLHTGEPE